MPITFSLTIALFAAIFFHAPAAYAGFFDTLNSAVSTFTEPKQQKSKKPALLTNMGTLKKRHIIQSVPMNGRKGLPKQTDNWSCGPHVAARLALFKGKNVSYKEVVKKRVGLGTPTMTRLTQFNPQAQMFFQTAGQIAGNETLVKIFMTSPEEEKILLEQYFKKVHHLEEATFKQLKGLISKNIPVAILIKNGQKEEPLLNKIMRKPVKLNYYHWVLAFGYDDDKKRLHYADSFANKPKEVSYKSFEDRWNTREKGFFLEVGTKLFLKERNMVWAE